MARELPSWIFWSTRASIDNEVPSVAAIVETCFAILFYWWFAIHFQTYLLLVISVVVAPFVLLRSDQSVAFGVKWIAEWERITWDDTRIARTERWLAWFLATPAALSGFLISLFRCPIFSSYDTSGRCRGGGPACVLLLPFYYYGGINNSRDYSLGSECGKSRDEGAHSIPR